MRRLYSFNLIRLAVFLARGSAEFYLLSSDS